MKFKSMMLAGLVFGMMASCQDDEVVNVNNGESEGDAYMSLSIEMPNVNGSTRAINGGSETAPGTEEEQKITSLKLFVFNEKGEVKNSKVDYQASDLVPVKPNPASPSHATTYTIPAFKIESGNKKVLVIINPLDGKFDSANAASMGQSMELTEEEIKSISTNNKFMMTNINREQNKDGLVSVDVQGTKNNPTSVTVQVERSVAKIEEMTTNYDFTVKNTQDQDHVVFKNVVLMNGNRKFYPIMQIQQNTDNQSNDYVKDPNFNNNTTEGNFIKNNFYSTEFTVGSFTPGDQNKLAQALSSEEKAPNALYYTLENTMTKDQQMNAYTTGLYYQAQYKLGNQEGNVYMFGGKLYTFTGLSQSAGDLGIKLNDPETGAELNDNSTQEDFDKIGVKKYVNGVCYYPYWIKHVPSDSNLDAMEFAVVRNNHYQITINSVKEIGSYKPVNPDPGTPDEEVEAYLDVKVKVLPWTVRKNQIDF